MMVSALKLQFLDCVAVPGSLTTLYTGQQPADLSKVSVTILKALTAAYNQQIPWPRCC